MVEKVFISPNRVRAYGNILESKTVDDFGLVDSTLTESTDTINNVVQKVFTLEAQTSEITVSLTASSNSIYVGESVLLTATVLEDGVVVEGKTVTFKSGTTSLGTGTTDSNGVATYTLTPGSSGSLSLTASVGSIVSSSVSVAVTAVSVSSISLSSSESTVYVGETILLTASVAWNDGNIYEDTVITFKDGGTTLGTGVTDSNGVATYTITPGSSGSLSLTATGDSVTSGSVSVSVIEHTYSIAFSQSTYTASGGSATLECTLLEDNVAKSGATVTVSGSDGSVYNGITNTNGVASVTVSDISTDTTFTASYNNVSAVCTVTVPSYLFYDACDSSTGLSNYGAIRPISSSTTTSYLEYNSTENAYYVHANGDWGIIPITPLNGLDNYKITAEFKTKSSENTYQGGLGFIAETGTNNVIFRKYSTSCNSVVNDSAQQSIGTVRTSSSYWHKFEVTKQGRTFSVTVTDMDNGAVIGTLSRTITFDTYYVGFMTVAGTNYGSYVRNILAESL